MSFHTVWAQKSPLSRIRQAAYMITFGAPEPRLTTVRFRFHKSSTLGR